MLMVCVLFRHRDAPGEIIVLLKRKILELMRDYEDIEFFAEKEGLTAHANSIKVRFE